MRRFAWRAVYTAARIGEAKSLICAESQGKYKKLRSQYKIFYIATVCELHTIKDVER